MKRALVEQLKVSAKEVIDHDELDKLMQDGVSLLDESCPVRYIVTVQKLREGWDCPFAYVLGSVGNVATETAVEQLLGRVLRMPHAEPTGVPELDRAYAVVQSPDVLRTAKNLGDNLVRCCGFDADTVDDAFRTHRTSDPQRRLPVAVIPVSSPLDTRALPAALRTKIEYDTDAGAIHVQEILTREETITLRRLAAPGRPSGSRRILAL